MTTSPEIEKLFLEYLKDMGENPGGFIGLLKPEHLEKGDPKTLGREIQRGAILLEQGVRYMNFESYELEKGKTGSRLKEAAMVYQKMGEEIEKMTENEPKEYHLYVISILIDIVSSLLNHIEIHIEENETE